MSCYYFIEPDGDVCLNKKAIIEYMKEDGLKELTVFEAKRETGSGYFFCREFGEVGEINGTCGKSCEKYIPNNGKSGRCRHYGWLYEKTFKIRTFKIMEDQQ